MGGKDEKPVGLSPFARIGKFGDYLNQRMPEPATITDAMIERAAKSFYTSMYFKPASKERRAEWWDALTPLSREVFCDFARAALEAAFTEPE